MVVDAIGGIVLFLVTSAALFLIFRITAPRFAKIFERQRYEYRSYTDPETGEQMDAVIDNSDIQSRAEVDKFLSEVMK